MIPCLAFEEESLWCLISIDSNLSLEFLIEEGEKLERIKENELRIWRRGGFGLSTQVGETGERSGIYERGMRGFFVFLPATPFCNLQECHEIV